MKSTPFLFVSLVSTTKEGPEWVQAVFVRENMDISQIIIGHPVRSS